MGSRRAIALIIATIGVTQAFSTAAAEKSMGVNSTPLSNSVTIYGNLVKATHGKSRRDEVLGTGDDAQGIQGREEVELKTTAAPDRVRRKKWEASR